MSYNIFKTTQQKITSGDFKANQSITGNMNPLDFAVVTMDDDIIPGDDFEIVLDIDAPRLTIASQLYILRDLVHEGEGEDMREIRWHLPFFVQNKLILGNTVTYSCVKVGKSFLEVFVEGEEPKQIFSSENFSRDRDGFTVDLQRHGIYNFGATALAGQFTPNYIGFLEDDGSDLNDPDSYSWEIYNSTTPSTDPRVKAYAYSKDGKYFFSTNWIQENWFANTAMTNGALPTGGVASGEKELTYAKALGQHMPVQDYLYAVDVNSDTTKPNQVGIRIDTNRAVTKGQVFTFSYYLDAAFVPTGSYPLTMLRRIGFYVNNAWVFVDGADVNLEPDARGVFISHTVTAPDNATNMRCYAFTKQAANTMKNIKPRFYGFKLETNDHATMWSGNSTERQVPRKFATKLIDNDDSEILRVRGQLNAASYIFQLKPSETYFAEAYVRISDTTKVGNSALFGGRFYDNNPSDYWVQSGQFENYYLRANGLVIQDKNQPSNIEFEWTGETKFISGEWALVQFKVKAPSSHPNVANKIFMQLNMFNQVADIDIDYKDFHVYSGTPSGDRKTLLL